MSLKITPFILGSGGSAQAVAKSLASINVLHPEFGLTEAIRLKRGVDLAGELSAFKAQNPAHKTLFCICNPHALHAPSIVNASHAGFDAILAEKPAAVNLQQLHALKEIKTPAAVLHGYRQTWGVQTLKQMIVAGELGDLITVEGRYWQASAAAAPSDAGKSWKDDTNLAGNYDVYLDIASHWVDSAAFLIGDDPRRIRGWKSYVNGESPNRETHVQLTVYFPKGRALGSISKTVHGASNHFEIQAIGSKRSASWTFLRPDELFIGEGRDRRVLTRKTKDMGSEQSPFHAQGWLEGYIEISRALMEDAFLARKRGYPDLQSNLKLLESMFAVEWEL